MEVLRGAAAEPQLAHREKLSRNRRRGGLRRLNRHRRFRHRRGTTRHHELHPSAEDGQRTTRDQTRAVGARGEGVSPHAMRR